MGYIFVCGFPSSGTELLKSIIRAHSDIYLGEEHPFLPDLARRYRAALNPQEVGAVVDGIVKADVYGHLWRDSLDPETLTGGELTFGDVYRALLCPDPPMWIGNKTPQYAEKLPELRALFPDAKVILIVRDIRDVALSWRKKWGKSRLWCAHKWNERMLKAHADMSEQFGSDGLLIQYEDLVADFEKVAERICDFLGLSFDEGMLNFHENERSVALDGKRNYGVAVKSDNTNKWRSALGPNIVERIEEIAFDAMRLFEYKPEHATSTRPIGWIEKQVGVINDAGALCFVGNRAIKRGQGQYRMTAIQIELRKLRMRFSGR